MFKFVVFYLKSKISSIGFGSIYLEKACVDFTAMERENSIFSEPSLNSKSVACWSDDDELLFSIIN